MPLDEIAINQVDRRLDKLRTVLAEAQVAPGWIYYMRHALKLTLENLSKISGFLNNPCWPSAMQHRFDI